MRIVVKDNWKDILKERNVTDALNVIQHNFIDHKNGPITKLAEDIEEELSPMIFLLNELTSNDPKDKMSFGAPKRTYLEAMLAKAQRENQLNSLLARYQAKERIVEMKLRTILQKNYSDYATKKDLTDFLQAIIFAISIFEDAIQEGTKISLTVEGKEKKEKPINKFRLGKRFLRWLDTRGSNRIADEIEDYEVLKKRAENVGVDVDGYINTAIDLAKGAGKHLSGYNKLSEESAELRISTGVKGDIAQIKRISLTDKTTFTYSDMRVSFFDNDNELLTFIESKKPKGIIQHKKEHSFKKGRSEVYSTRFVIHKAQEAEWTIYDEIKRPEFAIEVRPVYGPLINRRIKSEHNFILGEQTGVAYVNPRLKNSLFAIYFDATQKELDDNTMMFGIYCESKDFSFAYGLNERNLNHGQEARKGKIHNFPVSLKTNTLWVKFESKDAPDHPVIIKVVIQRKEDRLFKINHTEWDYFPNESYSTPTPTKVHVGEE